jgi:polyisoprenyl-teichoic acid--peptidoglycan teichoic acid transferase
LKKFLWSIIAGLICTIAYMGFAFYGPGRSSIGAPLNAVVSNLPLGNMLPSMPNFSFGTLSQPLTLLFMGTDVMYEGRGKHLKIDKVALNGRSDTMMLVFINPPQNRVSVLSIPRDTEVNIGKYGVAKINSANALGGAECAKGAVTSLLDVPVDHFVVMNLQGLVELVNEIGGVTVEVPKKMSYMDWTAKLKIDLQPGVHTLTGNQSMGFVRFRHDDLGDIGRVQRQQMFLNAVSRKMIDPRAWVHVPALMDIAKQNIQTDLSDMDILAALNFIHGIPRENIKFVMLPGQFAGNGDWIADPQVKVLAAQLLNPEQEVVQSRRNITICVQNASSDPTLATKLAQALRKLGYVTWAGKDEKDPISARTRIITQNGNTSDAKMLQQDLGSVGEIINASIGNLTSSFTIVARDDIALDKIAQSSVDAPYVPPPPRPVVPRLASRRTNKMVSPTGEDLPGQEPGETEMMYNNPADTPMEGQTAEEPGEATPAEQAAAGGAHRGDGGETRSVEKRSQPEVPSLTRQSQPGEAQPLDRRSQPIEAQTSDKRSQPIEAQTFDRRSQPEAQTFDRRSQPDAQTFDRRTKPAEAPTIERHSDSETRQSAETPAHNQTESSNSRSGSSNASTTTESTEH